MSDNYLQAAKLYALIDNEKIFLQNCLLDMSLHDAALDAKVVYPQQIESTIPGLWKAIFVEFPDGMTVALPLSTAPERISCGSTITVDFA